MASTYSTRTRLEKQGSGENDDSWGTKLNTVIDLVDEGMDGYLAKSVAGSSNVTLSSTNGASDESRQKTLKFTGTLTGSIDVIVPAVEKFYGVWNATSGSFDLTFKPSGGTGLVIPQGFAGVVFTDGSTMYQLSPWVDPDSGDALELVSTDAGATVGPSINLYRNSASPAASDLLGELQFDGEDSGGGRDTYAAIQGQILDTTSASEDGSLVFKAALAGTLTELMELGSSSGVPELRVSSTAADANEGPFITLERDSASPADDDIAGTIRFAADNDGGSSVNYGKIRLKVLDVTAGTEDSSIQIQTYEAGSLSSAAEFGRPVGEARIKFIADGRPVADFDRLSSDGTIIQLSQGSTVEGTISVSGTTVSYNTFTGAHWSQWGEGCEPDFEPPIGTLLSSTGEEYDRNPPKPQLWKVKVTDKPGDRAVVGVYGGQLPGGQIDVHALGTIMVRVVGPVSVGDLLEASQAPGVAVRQADDIVRASTVGKVTRGDPRAHDRLVACVAYCG